ncbi:Monogalactosyldiacylglycerol synthase, family GT28 [Chondrus crispus]|uniref:monogalactosyldiacylglycerol synthase n=1 Tax=Chondrus crispus TaxID=2769 RepID=R7Q649_CHOCR|nr:Monogalactosyldiacylglycerol synthase, family GT28 [Chondrus crispus]CDF33474.1 Monogalactosyldiacylglycerol synthase, family GT28 [Chondrus crispus]|eukprot:XP_005713277.1 Monogalactosyldiacylglycerol synthase, family GT28 [Chondrus crispus]
MSTALSSSKHAIEDDSERESLVAQAADDPETAETTVLQGKPSPRSVNRFAPPPDAPHTDISALSLSSSPAVSFEVPIVDEEEKGRFRILVLMSDTGGGHRASAQALEAAFQKLYPGATDICTVDFWKSVAGFPFHNFPQQYSYCAKRPFLWRFLYMWAKFRPTRALTEFAFSLFCHSKVRRYFEAAEADLIISVHPLVNTLSLSVLAYMRDLYGRPTPPYVTVVTDLGGAHPTWFDGRADLTFVPSEPLQEMALENGVQEDRIRMLGLPIRSSFWEESRSIDELRKELGMALHVPTVLLVGGGDGVGGIGAIADAIAVKIAEEVGTSGGQLVVVCGKNKKLLEQMRARSWPVAVILKGFVNNMSEWMAACDILCSKAGPGTIAEAWIRGLPIILTGFLPGQEEGNVQLVTESGSGEFHASPAAIAACAARWVSDPELRGAVAGRATSMGRPSSSIEIARDVWQLGQTRLREREAFRLRMLQTPVQHVPNGYIAMTRYYLGSAVRSVQRVFMGMFGYHDAQAARPRE